MALGGDARTGGARRTRYGVLADVGGDHLVGEQSQEFGEGRGFDKFTEQLGCVVVTADVSRALAEFLEFRSEACPAEAGIDDATVLEPRAMLVGGDVPFGHGAIHSFNVDAVVVKYCATEQVVC